jgi:hypothetical protein
MGAGSKKGLVHVGLWSRNARRGRVHSGDHGGSGTWGRGRETRVVGVSTAEIVGGKLGKGSWLTGGVRRPARASVRTDVQR